MFRPVALLGIGLITAYRYSLSSIMGRTCRHVPSCSEYGIEALRRHGAWRGGWLLVSRLARCHPWGTHGLDPVPETLASHGLYFWRYGRWNGDHIRHEFAGEDAGNKRGRRSE